MWSLAGRCGKLGRVIIVEKCIPLVGWCSLRLDGGLDDEATDAPDGRSRRYHFFLTHCINSTPSFSLSLSIYLSIYLSLSLYHTHFRSHVCRALLCASAAPLWLPFHISLSLSHSLIDRQTITHTHTPIHPPHIHRNNLKERHNNNLWRVPGPNFSPSQSRKPKLHYQQSVWVSKWALESVTLLYFK